MTDPATHITHALVQEPHLRIDHLCAPQPNGVLVITFTERTNRTLDGLGFGGKALLDLNCDVLSIRTDIDAWYQNLLPHHLESIAAHLADCDRHYIARATYGSSMGAYAAIKFAQPLGANRVLALSPVFDIQPDWETRWSADRPHLDGRPMTQAADISDSCDYCIVFDPHDPDLRHVEQFRQIIPTQRLFAVRVPYGGHPVGPVLQETDLLKQVCRTVLIDGDPAALRGLRLTQRGQSARYLFGLAQACRRHRKFNWAVQFAQRATEINPQHAEYWRLLAILLDVMRRPLRAHQAAQRAIALDPEHPAFKRLYVSIAQRADQQRQATALQRQAAGRGVSADTPPASPSPAPAAAPPTAPAPHSVVPGVPG